MSRSRNIARDTRSILVSHEQYLYNTSDAVRRHRKLRLGGTKFLYMQDSIIEQIERETFPLKGSPAEFWQRFSHYVYKVSAIRGCSRHSHALITQSHDLTWKAPVSKKFELFHSKILEDEMIASRLLAIGGKAEQRKQKFFHVTDVQTRPQTPTAIVLTKHSPGPLACAISNSPCC